MDKLIARSSWRCSSAAKGASVKIPVLLRRRRVRCLAYSAHADRPVQRKPFNAAISDCEKRRQTHMALSLLVGMRRRALSPELIACSAEISACEKGWQPHKSLSLLVGM